MEKVNEGTVYLIYGHFSCWLSDTNQGYFVFLYEPHPGAQTAYYVRAYVCMCNHIPHIYMYQRIYICIYTHAYIYVFLYMYIWLNTYAFMCVRLCVCAEGVGFSVYPYTVRQVWLDNPWVILHLCNILLSTHLPRFKWEFRIHISRRYHYTSEETYTHTEHNGIPWRIIIHYCDSNPYFCCSCFGYCWRSSEANGHTSTVTNPYCLFLSFYFWE